MGIVEVDPPWDKPGIKKKEIFRQSQHFIRINIGSCADLFYDLRLAEFFIRGTVRLP
ncbi:MAG: hypothetical protein NTV68_09465 [Methanomicrobiales archaeon]|nr:hypothetical protein [Methanomicrobiales archaeon]